MIKFDFLNCSLLVIDDDAYAEDVVSHIMRDRKDLQISYERDSAVAVETAVRVKATVLLVDLQMPLIDGLEVTRRLRATEATRDLPIIVLSADDNADRKAAAFAIGANDYLVKWPDSRELIARVHYHNHAFLARNERDRAFAALRESQAELAASQAALLHAQKMDAIGQLTGGVAHDFNNVLQIIGGNLQLLKLNGDVTQRGIPRIDVAIAGVQRGAKLASHLLAFARKQPLQSIVVDVDTVLRNLDEMLQQLMGPRGTICCEISDGLWTAFVDPNALQNVLMNLAINARDAMEGHRTLTLRARNVSQGSAGPHGELAIDMVLVEVLDTGVGMPPEVVQRVFEPFFSTKPIGEGTGLGLSMAYGFAKQSGGEICVKSKVGEGTCVQLYLMKSWTSLAQNEIEEESVPVSGGVETILVVEDEEHVRQATVDTLSALGYTVISAVDAASAVAILDSGMKIDLVFSDVMMPGEVTSVDLRERIRAMPSEPKLLFTSGFADDIADKNGRVGAEVDLLLKPYDPETLDRRIRRALVS